MAPRPVSAYGISLFLHGIGVAAVSYGLLHAPVINDPSLHYQVRHLELHLPETPQSRAAEAMYPTLSATARQAPSQAGHAAQPAQAAAPPQPAAAQPVLNLRDGGSGKQILLQPDLLPQKTIAIDVPVPTVMIWTPKLKDVKEIIPPKPDIATTADVSTSVQLPNEELKLAAVPAKAIDKTPPVQTPPAGNTSPIATKADQPVKMAPATASKPVSEPTPAAVLSISDLRMSEGKATLPPVNETVGAKKDNGAARQPAQPVSGLGVTHPAPATAQAAPANRPAPAKPSGTQVASAASSAPADVISGETAERIELPKDGRFGVVVVGSSLADQYPETLQIWSDRTAYTAYLHVGTPKAWILQYAQLRTSDMAAAGGVEHLDAPWPYEIVRPNLLARDVNGDALMVHGILNESGHLEQLAIAYPENFPHASFVLNSLSKWQFRPARQGGHPTPVEVLLIIPEELD